MTARAQIRTFITAIVALALLLSGTAQAGQTCEIASHEVHVGRGTMPYLSAGSTNRGESVLLLHGLFAQKEQWSEVVCALANAGYRPIAPDLPGYGQSRDYDLSVYPLEAQVQLLHDFNHAIGVMPQHIAGNSMGGAIAALYVKTYPDSAHSLAFIGGPLGIGPWAHTVRNSILAGTNPFIPLTPEALDAELAMLLAHPPSLPPDLQATILAPYQQNTTHYIQVWNIVNLYGRMLSDHSGNQIPTLILWGIDDRVFAVADSKALAAKYPRHQEQQLPDTGHLPMVDSPEMISQAYINFLKRQAP